MRATRVGTFQAHASGPNDFTILLWYSWAPWGTQEGGADGRLFTAGQ